MTAILAAVLALCKALPALQEIVSAILGTVSKQSADAKAAASDSALNSDQAAISAFVKSAQANAGPVTPAR